MKKFVSIAIVTVLLAGCGSKSATTSAGSRTVPATKTEATTPKEEKRAEDITDEELISVIEKGVKFDVNAISYTYDEDGNQRINSEGKHLTQKHEFKGRLCNIEILDRVASGEGVWTHTAVVMADVTSEFVRLTDKHKLEVKFGVPEGEVAIHAIAEFVDDETRVIEPVVAFDPDMLFEQGIKSQISQGLSKEPIKFSLTRDEVKKIEIILNGVSNAFSISARVRLTMQDGLIVEKGGIITYRPKDFPQNYADKTLAEFQEYELWRATEITEFYKR